jgi:hypothetical protein
MIQSTTIGTIFKISSKLIKKLAPALRKEVKVIDIFSFNQLQRAFETIQEIIKTEGSLFETKEYVQSVFKTNLFPDNLLISDENEINVIQLLFNVGNIGASKDDILNGK